MFSIRILLAIGTVIYLLSLWADPSSLYEIKDIGIQSHDDIVVWGKEKIAFNFTATKDKVITYDEFKEEDIPEEEVIEEISEEV